MTEGQIYRHPADNHLVVIRIVSGGEVYITESTVTDLLEATENKPIQLDTTPLET